VPIKGEIKINEFGLVRIGFQHRRCKGFHDNLNNTRALNQQTFDHQLNKIAYQAIFQEALINLPKFAEQQV